MSFPRDAPRTSACARAARGCGSNCVWLLREPHREHR
jgi:hypothetical protein